MTNNLRLFCVGDAFISKRLSTNTDTDFTSLIDMVRTADAAFVNLETSIHAFEGYPIGEGKSDAYAQADPYIAEELAWAGFGLVSRANNHSMDYSAEGLMATSDYLDAAGITHAGAGADLGEARSPAYLETSEGIVSLVSATTYYLGHASASRKDVPGRPGVNPLRMDTYYDLSPQDYETVRKVASGLGVLSPSAPRDQKEFTFNRETRFRLSDVTKVTRTARKLDWDGNLKAVREASRLSDFTVFTLHDHYASEKAPPGFKPREAPLEQVREFAHASIESGADVFVGHGPHVLRGLEIYRGKPIFYSLGNFVFQSTLITRQPSDLFERWGLGDDASTADLYEKREAPPNHFFDDPEYWFSVAAECQYSGKALKEVKLHPLTLDYDARKPLKEQRTKAGIPRLAKGSEADKIMKEMIRLSEPYGTKIVAKERFAQVEL